MYRILCSLFFLNLCYSAFSQDISTQTQRHLMGYWEGAFIKNNAYQKIDIQFYENDEKLTSLQIMEEWHPVFGEFELPVDIDSLGIISMNTGYGKAKMQLDSNNLEIIGHIENQNPSVYIHFKKVPEPPALNYTVEPVEVTNGEISLQSYLHRPNSNPTKTAVILATGRGCYPISIKYNLYAKFLRQYGITVLAYRKRGVGQSSGDCATATLDDLASDVLACKRFLENHPDGYENIGVIGSSAGGWVMAKAEEQTDFDFMIGIVGPSTSVREQQFQSMEYGCDLYKLTETARKNIEAYTNLLFDAPVNEASFKKIMTLHSKAEAEGWNQLLDDTDIPKSMNEMDNLWVRRHDYDPRESLANYNQPLLMIYGERDWIVPHAENVNRLKEIFSGDRAKLLTTVVAHNAEHGTETEGKYIQLGEGQSYWHFYRIAPEVTIEIVKFMKENGWMR